MPERLHVAPLVTVDVVLLTAAVTVNVFVAAVATVYVPEEAADPPVNVMSTLEPAESP